MSLREVAFMASALILAALMGCAFALLSTPPELP